MENQIGGLMRFKASIALLSIAVLLTANGCASDAVARPDRMAPPVLNLEKHHPYSVSLSLQVTPFETYDLTTALASAITNSNAFSTVVPDGGDYRLEVEAFFNVPDAGWDHTVRIGGVWRLTNQQSGAVVFDEFIQSSHTVKVAEVLSGLKRVRRAKEGAAQKFISAGRESISALDL